MDSTVLTSALLISLNPHFSTRIGEGGSIPSRLLRWGEKSTKCPPSRIVLLMYYL